MASQRTLTMIKPDAVAAGNTGAILAHLEKAGFKNAIVAKIAPTLAEDPDWSAEDGRYSTVRWTAAHRMGYAIDRQYGDHTFVTQPSPYHRAVQC